MAKLQNQRVSLRNNQSGFVIIIALGMILILSIFAIMIQQTTINTLSRMKDYENIGHAQIWADSVMEYLSFIVNENGGAGITTGKIVCAYGSYANEATGATSADNPDFCKPFLDDMVATLNEGGKTHNIKIVAEIKGRAGDGLNATGSLAGAQVDGKDTSIATTSGTTNESFTSGCPGISSACYVVPFPGTGTAGKNCEFYAPDFAAGASGTSSEINIKTGKLAEAGLATDSKVGQIDYSCNWNKLTFGSSTTDRATIPLYYTQDGGETVSPFSNDTVIGGSTVANSFVVRVRTPCKPVTDADGKTSTPVDCADDKRYILNEKDGDDIVVQWQITGLCKKSASSTEYEEECGMIQFSKYQDKNAVSPYFSAINEGRINYGSGMATSYPDLHNTKLDDTAHKLLYPILRAVDTSEYEKIMRISQNPSSGTPYFLKLPTMKNPTLSLFLSNKLISDDGGRVPYLEYQVLTSTPVSDSKIKMEVTVTFNGNTYKKTIYKEEQKPLIDFAIQN